MFGRGRTRGSDRRAAVFAGALLLSIAAAGCTVAASPSPAPAAAESPAATEAATPTMTPTATPSPTKPEAAATVPANATPASGAWTGLRWISDGKPAPTPEPEATKQTSGDQVFTSVSIFGWSRGYVGFDQTETYPVDLSKPSTYSLVAESSTDGLSWKRGAALQMPAGSKAVSEADTVASIGRVVEGPGGLLAMGYGPAVACGGPATVKGLWISTDGIVWSPVAMPFGSDGIFRIDGGGAGYIGMGQHANGEPALWTSTDGRTWTSSTPPVSAKTGSLQDAAAFSAGFVVVGAVKGDEGCGGPSAVKPSVWWSADGKSWARETLPGAPAASDSWMSVSRLGDDALFAVASTADATTQKTTTTFWTSHDGRTWARITPPADIENFVTDGSHAIGSTFDDGNNWHFWAFEPDGSIRELAQTGTLPPSPDYGGQFALGPAGLVMRVDGDRFFLGVPTK